ncbi:MAG: hypothetical protein ACKVI6_04955 [Candidatus Poseidoniales archaeon]|mgnify:CR=1 FL=1|jgi:hypothetical protein|tara:strand:+ start:792 stop:1298 length:507 start_codon:yes stop_codon:yes gene_type:complete
MRKVIHRILIVAILTLFSLPIASAHGDGNPQTISNLYIMIIAILTSLFSYMLLKEWINFQSEIFTPLTFSLALYTGTVHILLGLDDSLLLVGGLGIYGILFLTIFAKLNQQTTHISWISLLLILMSMFVAYFVSNPDIHYIVEDYLGLSSKLSEGLLMFLLYVKKKSI